MSKNKAQRSILFVSLREDTAEYYLAELREIFREEVELYSYSFEQESGDSRAVIPETTVILAASPASYARCRGLFPQEKLLLFSRDILFPYYLDQVFLLPPGTRVLVVNELQEAALEVIRQMREKNITHLEYIPYWEGCATDISGVDTAISPGLLRYCPPEVTRRIDIRRRHLSVGIFITLLQRLGLNFEYVERLLLFHSNLLFDTYRRLSDTYVDSLRLRKILESILSNVPDAILFTEDGLIIECNTAAENLFRRKRALLLNRPLRDIFSERAPDAREKSAGSTGQTPDASFVLTINKANYLCIRTDISTKPRPAKRTILYTLKAVSELENMEQHVRKLLYMPHGNPARYKFSDIIAADAAMLRVLDTAGEMAKSPLGASILITGESGTGKELFAQAIHNASRRAGQPFVPVNFGAIPDNLVESELFGYEGGAFTGASKTGKKGLFEVALRGTIFLDEISNASLWIQARLLRVLEEKELIRLGGTTVVPVDVRVIAATNRDLLEMCRKGTFRLDLYHRLNAFPLRIPPLRERKACIAKMVEHFQSARAVQQRFSEEAASCVYRYNWPGNARELKNMIDFLTLKPGGIIEVEDLPPDVRSAAADDAAEFGNLLAGFAPYCSVELLSSLLRLFESNAGESPRLGRERLRGKLSDQGFSIGDAGFRTLARRLAGAGLIEKGKTKQGTVITGKGKRLLAHIGRLC
ncbi:MAG: sigma 54-interacting transcriptional regulator [Deltaproteobacteria bacterium]|jgi:transcriptional regulator with PAS, ATPase and Fis domain|nr:sigma 54-interacting transcriptional regulator [Deltaproteobacteria bacterium]